MRRPGMHRARMPAVRQTLPVAHLVPPTWRFLSSSLAPQPTPILPRPSRSRAAFPAHWAAHGPPGRRGPRHRTAARIPPGQAFRSSHDWQLAGRMDAAHVPGHPHPGMSSRCLAGPGGLAGPARPFPGPARARPNALAGLNRRGHPGCGCRSRALRMSGRPTDDRRSRGPRRGGPLPAGRSRARHVRHRRQPPRCPVWPHHEGPHHEAGQTTAQHPLSSHPTGRRPAAAHLAMPHPAARRSDVLLPVAAHFVAHQPPLQHQSGPHHEGQHQSAARQSAARQSEMRQSAARQSAARQSGMRQSGMRQSGARQSGMRRPPGADRLLPHWLDLHCPGPDRVGARPCSQRCLRRPRAGHVRCPVPNPAHEPAYLGGPPADALGNRRPGHRQTTRTTCLAGQDRPSPSPDAPLPRSSSKLASRPPCR